MDICESHRKHHFLYCIYSALHSNGSCLSRCPATGLNVTLLLFFIHLPLLFLFPSHLLHSFVPLVLFISLRSLRHWGNLGNRCRFGTCVAWMSAGTDCPHWFFRGLPQSLQTNAEILTQIRQLPSTLLQICCSLILTELLILSLIKPLIVQTFCFLSSVSVACVRLSPSAFPASFAFRV
jgi:hypothetical protein